MNRQSQARTTVKATPRRRKAKGRREKGAGTRWKGVREATSGGEKVRWGRGRSGGKRVMMIE